MYIKIRVLIIIHCRSVTIQELCKYTFNFDNYLILKLYC